MGGLLGSAWDVADDIGGGALKAGSGAVDTAVDAAFNQPGELPGVSSEDSVDLWGGSPSSTASAAADTAVDTAFQRPGELPGVSSEDSIDIPFGSLMHPTGDPHFNPTWDDNSDPVDTRPLDGLLGQHLGLIVVAIVGLYLLGQLVDYQAGGSAA